MASPIQELIDALQIFQTYMGESEYPTNCSHDVLWVNVDPAKVSEIDKHRLEDLGFTPATWEYGDQGFMSFKYGSC